MLFHFLVLHYCVVCNAPIITINADNMIIMISPRNLIVSPILENIIVDAMEPSAIVIDNMRNSRIVIFLRVMNYLMSQ